MHSSLDISFYSNSIRSYSDIMVIVTVKYDIRNMMYYYYFPPIVSYVSVNIYTSSIIIDKLNDTNQKKNKQTKQIEIAFLHLINY